MHNVGMHLMSLNCALKNGESGQFYVAYVLPQCKSTSSVASHCPLCGLHSPRWSGLCQPRPAHLVLSSINLQMHRSRPSPTSASLACPAPLHLGSSARSLVPSHPSSLILQAVSSKSPTCDNSISRPPAPQSYPL